jgi:site-specific recombinase XerD
MREHFKTIFEEYTKLIEVKHYSSHKMYKTAVFEFLEFQTQRAKHKTNFSQADMIAYFEYLSTRKNKRRSGTLSQSTINHHLFALHQLFDYLLRANYEGALPVVPKYLRAAQTETSVLSVEEVKELYNSCENEQETAILSVAYGAGLRRSEIEALNITDVHLRDATLIVQSGKNSKRREVPLSDKVVKDLKEYLHNFRTLKSKDRKAFFINKLGYRLRGNYINTQVIRITERTTITQRVTLHTLRRSIATHLADNGAGIYFIQDFLGHTLIDTSHLYMLKRKRKITL